MALTLHHGRIVRPAGVTEPLSMVASDQGQITYVGPEQLVPRIDGLVVDLQGSVVAPGFIDLHVHGGFGVEFGRPGRMAEDLRAYSRAVLSTGVTGFLCTVAAAEAASLAELVRECASALGDGMPGAEALGLHLEGPFLNPARRGAYDTSWLRAPNRAEVEALLAAGQGCIRMVTVAPELPGAAEVAAGLRRAGVVVALGHSDADYATASAALAGDWTHVSHAFNAQRGFHHREPGVVGAVLTSQSATAEVISDGVHVHPAAIRVLVRCLGTERVVAITDAVPAAGLADGEYGFWGRTVRVKDGQARLPNGTLAGSATTLDQCVRRMVGQVGVPLHEAMAMASRNPAGVLGLHRLGSIAVGRDANLVVVDDAVRVCMVCVRGRMVYRAE